MKIAIAMIAAVGLFAAADSDARAQSSDVTTVECWFLDGSSSDWTETAAADHGVDTLVSNCQSQGGIPWIELDGD